MSYTDKSFSIEVIERQIDFHRERLQELEIILRTLESIPVDTPDVSSRLLGEERSSRLTNVLYNSFNTEASHLADQFTREKWVDKNVTVGMVMSRTYKEWMKTPNTGRLTVREINELLSAHGVQLK